MIAVGFHTFDSYLYVGSSLPSMAVQLRNDDHQKRFLCFAWLQLARELMSSVIPMLSVSQNSFSIFVISSTSFTSFNNGSPEMMRFEMTLEFSCTCCSSVGPDRSQPNLLLMAVGPNSPWIDSPVII